MAPRVLKPPIRAARTGIRSLVRRSPAARRAVEVVTRELTGALDDGDFYGARYFGVGRHGAGAISGYDVYDRTTSNARESAYLIWRFFPARSTLDVGCAMGFVVEALRELGVEAHGTDISEFAVKNAPRKVRKHLRVGSLLDRLPYDDRSFDVVSALETLEHLEPEAVPVAIAELARVSSGYVIATIPSFGPNASGPDGWLDGKVAPDRLEHYKRLGDDFDGPVAFDDLERDAAGEPVEGHLTIASFRWWTARFAEAGLERCAALERRLEPVIDRFGLTGFWNIYVFAQPGTPDPGDGVRNADEIERAEARWKFGAAEARA